MATITKVDMDKCSSLVLYKTMAKIRDEIHDKMVLDSKRKPHAVSIMADAAHHYVPTSKDNISIDADGFPNFRDWSDTDLCNNKTILEALGITKGILPASTYVDHKGDDVPIPMLMTGVEIDPNSDEYQKWYRRFTLMPGSVIPQAQAEINGVMNKYLEERARTGRKKQGPLYATEKLRDAYIHLQNKLISERSKLRTSHISELSKPIRSHKQIIATREIIEINLGMIEDAFGLPFQSEESMTAINFVNAQIEGEEDPTGFASEADKLGFFRALHELKLQYEKEGRLDLGQTFDRLTRTFRVREETILEDDTLHSALMAQVQPQRKFGQLRNDNVKRSPPQRNHFTKKPESPENHVYGKILQALHDLKSDVGTIKKSLNNAGIQVGPTQDHKYGKGQPQPDRQKTKFAGIAKKTKLGKIIASRSLVQNREIEISDTDEEEDNPQAQLAEVVTKAKKAPVNYRAQKASFSSMMRFDHVDLQKGSPDPLDQYPQDDPINDASMDEDGPATSYQAPSPQISNPESVSGESVQGIMNNLSVMSSVDSNMGSGEEQPESAEESDQGQTPLAGRTRSARASQPRQYNIPDASFPDDSDDEYVSASSTPAPIKAKNKYERQILRKSKVKSRFSVRGK